MITLANFLLLVKAFIIELFPTLDLPTKATSLSPFFLDIVSILTADVINSDLFNYQYFQLQLKHFLIHLPHELQKLNLIYFLQY